MIDISDGLIADLGHVARASAVRVDVTASRLLTESVARVSALRAAAALLGADCLPWVLTGGDDHALAATFPAQAPLPDDWTVIGRVTEGAGVTIDGRAWSGQGGWEHFSAGY
jgi:thiamine-monophosphate kinase